jgi:integrase
MKRERNRLTTVGMKALTKPGRYADGAGLYLLVKPDGRRTWVFRWRDRLTGKLRDKGLGAELDVGLAEARDRASACRRILRDGGDPIADPKQHILAARLERARRKTFGECKDAYIAAHAAEWRNEKHQAQWEATLTNYAAALLPLPVAEIDTAMVVNALEPIWTTKTETATRTRQRIEAVLDWATARKLRTGDNPARWRGHLDHLLASPNKLKAVKHRPALAYDELAAFMVELRAKSGYGARALELQILTAARPGEVAAATWGEFDLKGATWTIPGARMKAGREHRVPLAPAAVALLKALPRHPDSTDADYVFPGLRKGQPMTTAAALKILKDLRPGVVAHGFRSTFRDWAADRTAYPREIAEAALAHQLSDKTEAAYRRTDLFEKRANLMRDWAKFCVTPRAKGDNVKALRGVKR